MNSLPHLLISFADHPLTKSVAEHYGKLFCLISDAIAFNNTSIINIIEYDLEVSDPTSIGRLAQSVVLGKITDIFYTDVGIWIRVNDHFDLLSKQLSRIYYRNQHNLGGADLYCIACAPLYISSTVFISDASPTKRINIS